jgi:hypothetical protein
MNIPRDLIRINDGINDERQQQFHFSLSCRIYAEDYCMYATSLADKEAWMETFASWLGA